MTEWHAVVLAAGQGTRMKSALPKVLHPVAGLPMLSHVLRAAHAGGATAASVVLPPDAAPFQPLIASAPLPVSGFVQTERLGTAHAVLAAADGWKDDAAAVAILYGDTPLVQQDTLRALVQSLQSDADLTVLAFEAANPTGYGRLITGPDQTLTRIVEEKDASPEEKRVTLCNSGILACRAPVLLSLLRRIGNRNAAGEYYLTDAIGLAAADGLRVRYRLANESDMLGVNNRVQLAEAEAMMQARLRHRAMEGGATLIAPATVTFSHDTVLGRDVTVEPNVIFGPGVTIGDNVTVKGFSHIEGATIASGAIIGPFARIRPTTVIGHGARIGNFVEVKETTIADEAKISHLSYIGDAAVGVDANIGAGTITCNYDGVVKHRTEIGAGAFVGSNSALVAPVVIGDGAYVGSGSVITRDVPKDALAVARGEQIVKEGWALRRRNGPK
jgi:bifunctional UDP-N-acetylglucosamine pyrophosphorylase/glucosamine-1-phosphate N-acetyltransferase